MNGGLRQSDEGTVDNERRSRGFRGRCLQVGLLSRPLFYRFELYRRSGSGWVLSRSVAVAVDLSGVASTTFTFARGSWYVRAQAQPTRVNANSLWTPSQYYTAP